MIRKGKGKRKEGQYGGNWAAIRKLVIHTHRRVIVYAHHAISWRYMEGFDTKSLYRDIYKTKFLALSF